MWGIWFAAFYKIRYWFSILIVLYRFHNHFIWSLTVSIQIFKAIPDSICCDFTLIKARNGDQLQLHNLVFIFKWLLVNKWKNLKWEVSIIRKAHRYNSILEWNKIWSIQDKFLGNHSLPCIFCVHSFTCVSSVLRLRCEYLKGQQPCHVPL